VAPLRTLFGEDATVLRETDFQLLLLATTLPVLGTLLVSPLLDSLVEPFGTTPANIGLMISFMTAPGIVMIPVAGVLADRIGRKPVLVVAVTLFGLSGAAVALTTDFRVVLGLRFLQGVGFAGIGPILITSIRDQYSGTKEATAQGLRLSWGGISGAVFPLLSGLLVVVAWQYPFLLYLIALPIAGLLVVFFEEPTTESGTADESLEGSYHRELVGLVRHPRVIALVIARALPNVVWIGFYTYNSIIVVRVIGGTPPVAGLLAALGNVVFALSASQAGRVTSVTSGRLVPLLGANLALGVGFVVVLFSPVVAPALVGITLMGAGTGLLLSLYRSLVTGLAPESLRSGLVSIAESAGRVANTLTPIVMGAGVAAATPALGFAGAVRATGLGVAVVASAGGILCLFVARRAAKTPAETATVAES
jgi:MFS family permease